MAEETTAASGVSEAEVKLIRDIYNHPEARKYIQEAAHIVYPKSDIPERTQRLTLAELEKKGVEQVAKLDTKIAEFEKKQEREWTRKQLAEAGYAPEAIAGITDLMDKEGLNVANASVVYQARTYQPPSRTPISSVGGMSPKAYGRGAWGEHFRGIFDGDFHTPGQEWSHALSEQILTDFANGQGKKWDDPNYWPPTTLPAPVKG